MTQKNLQKLFEKSMNRREFLAHIGAALLMVLGVSGLLKHLLDYGAHSRRHVAGGYGSASYGGGQKRLN